MKNIMFTLILALLPAVAIASSDHPVSFEELPDAARQFIRTHFPEAKITLATIDREFMDTSYDVIFTDGTKIEFDSGGEWKEIESRRSFVPQGVIPSRIAKFIREQFPDAKIRDIERDRRGCELSLDNRRELRFDSRGNFLGYDD